MRQTNPRVDGFLRKATRWQEEFTFLRKIVLACELTEDFKWRWPCYTFQEKNVALLHGFKDYCALLFFKGALLKDPENVLVRQTQEVQAARQIRFTSVRQILTMKPILKAYLDEAIAAEKAGLKIPRKATSEFTVLEEFRSKLDERPALKSAFAALTPGRQRGYLLYFGAAKQSKTREARIKKWMPQILHGKGMDDE